MKNVLLLFAVALSIGTCLAQARKTIKVSDFQFSPATTNAQKGDTIVWVWKGGGHTTTSLQIPADAKPWDKPINQNAKRFKYVVKKRGTYNYQCNPHAPFMAGKIRVTAPTAAGLEDVSLISKDAAVVLNWQVKDNSKVSFFSVQRSTDGDNFTEIARVQPSAVSTYIYADKNVLPDKYVYYQLELTDKEGDTELSDIKMFTNERGDSKLITSLSPNPIKNPGHLMLRFNAAAAGKMRVQLFTQDGKLITETGMVADKGLNNGHFHLGDLKPGTYYLVCTLGNKNERHTIIYQ